MFANQCLLIIGTVWPEPNSSAAGTRMMQLIDFFQQEGAEITFACSASNLQYSEDLEELDIKTANIKVNDSSFDEFIRSLKPDIVLFDRFMTEEQFGWRVAEQCPDSLRILDTEDLHFLRYARHQAFKEGREFKKDDLYSEEAKREIASIYRCDLSLIISKVEFELLTNFFNIDESILQYVPFLLDPLNKDHRSSLPSFDERNHFISIGNFLHEPNWDAVLYLKEEIWSLIRKELPHAELHIYGAYTSPKVEQLHNQSEGFLIKGRAEDAGEVIKQAKVLLAPLRFGAGLKGKLVDAMKDGTPFITTDIGGEGLGLEIEESIANDPKQFAKCSIQLFKSSTTWSIAQKRGFDRFNDLFDKTVHHKKLKEKISQVKAVLETHRNRNFIGSILHKNTLQSYKYMSKWIEEKNKNL
jgi:hypothetical protein